MIHFIPATSTATNKLSTTIFSRHVRRVSTYVTITQVLQRVRQHLEQHWERTFWLQDYLDALIYQLYLHPLVIRPWNQSSQVSLPHRNMFSGFQPGSSR